MKHEEIDLRFYMALIRRWWWILVLGVMVTAGTAFFLSRAATPIYVASAKIMVQPRQGFQPSTSDIQASQQLALSYSDLITTRPVMEEVIEELSLSYTPQALTDILTIKAPRSLIVIEASNPDPELAATISNVTADVFINRFREQQLLELARLQTSLADYGIDQTPEIIAAQAATASALTVVESAMTPLKPASPNTRLNVILGALIGLAVAGGIVFFLERLDDTVKSPDELKDLTGLATLGSVFRWPADSQGIPVTIADEHQRTSLAESFKFLTASLEFSAAGAEDFKSILFTSASPGEGKTTTAINLAIALARQGKSVILVDVDLRKPQIHRVFDCPSTPGLTNLLLGNSSLEQALILTKVPGLRVVTSGPIPPDPTQILRLPRTRETIAALRDQCDILLLDTPPVLAVADALVLAGLVDGAVLVVDTRHTSRNAVIQAVETLQQTPAVVLGAVLNKIAPKGRGRYYYYHYYHYYYYYPSSGDGVGERRQKGFGARLLDKLMFGQADGSHRRRRRSRGKHRRSSASRSGDVAQVASVETPQQDDNP